MEDSLEVFDRRIAPTVPHRPLWELIDTLEVVNEAPPIVSQLGRPSVLEAGIRKAACSSKVVPVGI
jgi:hypothetical protein